MTEALGVSRQVFWMDADPSPVRYMPGRRMWVLCPAIAYQIFVSRSPSGESTIFEQVVMNLARAGIVGPEDVSKRSGLPIGLAGVIVRKLEQDGLLDADGRCTARGALQSESTSQEGDPTEPCLVFHDPFHGALWHRVVMRGSVRALPLGGTTSDGRELNRVELPGDAGRQFTANARLLRAPAGVPAFVRHVHVQHAARRASDALRSFEQRQRQGSARPAHLLSGFISRIHVPEGSAGSPCLLLTYVFVPEKQFTQRGWLACDPFGLGVSDRMAACVERAAEGDATLRKELDALVQNAYAVTKDAVVAEVAERAAVARKRVSAEIGADFETLGELGQRILDAEIEAGFALSRGAVARDNVASKVHAALEEALCVLQGEYGVAVAVQELSYEDADENARLLLDIARRIGFSIGAHEGEVEALVTQGIGPLRAVACHDGRGLGRQAAAALFAASRDRGHPLHHLAARWPAALEFLAVLAGTRNRQSHGGAAQAPIAAGDAISGMYRIVRGLFPNLRGSSEVPVDRLSSDQWEGRLQYRLHMAAVRRVRERYGARLREHQALHERLVLMQFRAELLERISGTSSPWMDVAGSTTELLREGVAALEVAVGECLSVGTRPRIARRTAGDDAESCTSAALAIIAGGLGFDLCTAGLPDGLSGVKPWKVERAIRETRGELGALVLACIRSAREDQRHPFRSLAANRPATLIEIGEVLALRQHGDRRLASGVDAAKIVEAIHQIIEGILGSLYLSY